MLKKLFIAVFLILTVIEFSLAGAFSNFQAAVESDLEPFSRDIGGLLGSGSFHTARALGFSGFDAGARAAAQMKPELSDGILEKDKEFYISWVQGELGMPYRIDAFVRGGNSHDLVLVGGGARYGIRKVSDEPGYLQVMLVGLANKAVHRHFYITHFGSNLVFSIAAKRLIPYLGAGFDSTKLVVKSADNAALAGKIIETFEPRYSVGLKLKSKYAYIAATGTLAHSRTIIEGSLGIRF
ncbi:MAG: hypothetical protein HY746_02925 [Elusimicrobia bacterium]|nr:hypothetical protein [Elusimicrobiota bacterium]